MLNKTLAAAALALGTSVIIAAPADAAPGYAVGRLEVRAGPAFDYPTVGFARPGTRIEINGCLPDWSWCDVTTARDRGWVRANEVQAFARGRRLVYGSPWNVPTFSFSFGTYWDSHYRNRPFYRDRGRWEHHGYDHGHGRGPNRHDRDHDGRPDWRDRHDGH
jgi:uncharacterized protein YraI